MPNEPQPITVTERPRWGEWVCGACGRERELKTQPELGDIISCTVCHNRFKVAAFN